MQLWSKGAKFNPTLEAELCSIVYKVLGFMGVDRGFCPVAIQSQRNTKRSTLIINWLAY